MSHEGPPAPWSADSDMAEARGEGQSMGKGKSGARAPAATARVAGVDMSKVTGTLAARAPAAVARISGTSVFQRLAQMVSSDESVDSGSSSEESDEWLKPRDLNEALPHKCMDQNAASGRVLHPEGCCTDLECKVADNAEHHGTVANVGTDVIKRGARQLCKSEVSSSEPASDSEHEPVNDQFVSENVLKSRLTAQEMSQRKWLTPLSMSPAWVSTRIAPKLCSQMC